MILLCRWEDGLDIETIIQIYVRYIPLLGYIIGLAMSQMPQKICEAVYEMNRLDLTPLNIGTDTVASGTCSSPL